MNKVSLTTLLLAIFVFSSAATAQTFPANSAWLPVVRTVNNVTAPVGDVTGDSQSERDIVGDALRPAVYLAADATYLYTRIRLNDPGNARLSKRFCRNHRAYRNIFDTWSSSAGLRPGHRTGTRLFFVQR